MPLLDGDICRATQEVCNGFLGMPVELCPQVPPPPEEEIALTVCVRFTGAWKGALILGCPAELARRVAAVMFRSQPDQVTTGDARDALAELTNMIGGNLKALLPAPSRIGLPTVTKGNSARLRVCGDRILNQLVLRCQGQPVSVTLLEFD
jgi:chemotaxis protein CheX